MDARSTLASLERITLDQVALVATTVPLVRPFVTSFGRQDHRQVLLVKVTASRDGHQVTGWGECVAPVAPVYSEEFSAGAALVLTDHLVPALTMPGRTLEVEDLEARLRHLQGNQMARASLEQAVLDASLQLADRSLAEALGAIRSSIEVGVSVGIPDGGVPELIDEVAGYLAQGYRRVKIKVTPGFDVEPVQALRASFGDDLDLQVDANAAYDPSDATHLAALDRIDQAGLVLIEQPFAPGRLRAHAHHQARWRTPVCLDESIHDADDARDAIAMGACRVVNIKPGRVGGLLEALRIRDACRDAGIPVWCGGMLETGIGRAANVALAATEGFDLPADASASDRYWVQDLTEPFVLEDGRLAVPDAPGIGRRPAPERLINARVEPLLR